MKTVLLLGGLTGLLLVAGQALGGQSGMVIALLLAVVMNFSSYWFSDKLVLKIYRARPVTRNEAPVLYETVQELANRAGLPMPRVYIVDNEAPNAFATGRDPQHAAVAATTGLLRLMNRDELAGVMAHELAHVEHRDTLIGAVAATIAGAIAMLANFAQFAMIFGMGRRDEGGSNPLVMLIMMIVAPMAASLIQMAVSRSREFAADARGAAISGRPLGLASALRKLSQANSRIPMRDAEEHPATAHMFIVNPLKGRNLAQLFSTHPPVEERIRRLEAAAGMR
jgi:heat shock protein HtpX